MVLITDGRRRQSGGVAKGGDLKKRGGGSARATYKDLPEGLRVWTVKRGRVREDLKKRGGK